MVATLHNTNHFKSWKLTDADEDTNTQTEHTTILCMTAVLFVVCF